MSANATKAEPTTHSAAYWPPDEAYELATILDSVLDSARALIPADAYAIWLFEPSREEWRVAASRGLSRTFTAEIRAGEDAMPATPICAEDVQQVELLRQRASSYRQEGIHSLMALPIFIQSQRRGTLVYYFRAAHTFGKTDVQIGKSLARLSSSAFAASELYREQSLAKARSDFLAEASAVLASSLDYGETLATVARLAVPQVADWCAIDLVAGNDLKRVAVAHKDEKKVEWVREAGTRFPQTLDSGTGVAKVIASRRSELIPVVEDAMLERSARSLEHLAALRQLQIRSVLAVPLLHREEILGAITFVNSESDRSFTEQDRALAEALAGRAAVAIENARLFTALERSERNFRAVSETAACAIFIHDGTQVVFRNRAAAEMIGLQQGEAHEMWERVHPQDREMVKARAIARLRGEDPPARYEFRIMRPDGAVLWLDLTATTVEYGGAHCILATAFDVTERRFAVEQMQRREQETRSLIDNLPDVISRFDRNLRHLYVSPHVERLTGRPAAASVGKTFEEIGYPAPLCELWNDSLRRVFDEGVAHSVQFSFQAPDGQVRHFVATGVPEIARGGVVESVVTFSRDITEQRNTVQQLKSSQTQLRLIIDSVPGLVAYIDAEERFRRVNRTFEEWFQQPIKSFLGRKVRDVVGQENYRQLAPRLAQALAGEEVQFEVTNTYPDATRHVLITYVPDVDDAGHVGGVVALIIDVTERRKAEDALRKTEKLAAAGRLAASIAHEINNPLESVTNLLYLLDQESDLSTAGREYLNLAEQELTRVSQIATQTLRFHRHSTKAGSVRLEELLDSMYSLYRGRFDRLGVMLEHRYRDTEPIQGFEGELRQLFANLIANALDAMPSGGRMLLRTKPKVHDGVRGIQVTVADTGQGIAKELRGRIFEPFVTSKGMTGTGLGLWVSREIVQKHRGTIRVRSRSEGTARGTAFVVFLAQTPSPAVLEN